MIRALAILFFATTVSHAETLDLILEIYTWDNKTAKTMSGWFADSEEIRAIAQTDADVAPTRKLIATAKNYLLKNFSEISDSQLNGPDPFMGAELPPNKSKVKDWQFEEMIVKPLDLGRVRGTLISWDPEPTGLFYYKLIFRPEFEGRAAVNQRKSVIVLPNLEVIPYQEIDATLEEKKQIAWWESHMGHITHEEKEELIQTFVK